jgi:hypothetical protein
MSKIHDDDSAFNLDNTPLWKITAAQEYEWQQELEDDEFWKAYSEWASSLESPAVDDFLQTDEGAALRQSIADTRLEAQKWNADGSPNHKAGEPSHIEGIEI